MKNYKKEFDVISEKIGNSYEDWEKVHDSVIGINKDNFDEKIAGFRKSYELINI